MTAKIKRSQFKTFINTTPLSSDTWSLLGDGVKTSKIAYNPKITDETYVSDDNATISVDSYAPKMAVSQIAKYGDAVFNFIDGLRQAHAITEAAQTYTVDVWMYQAGGPAAYPATKQQVAIQIDDFGGDGGVPAEINYTINYIGAPIPGTFNSNTLAFTPS